MRGRGRTLLLPHPSPTWSRDVLDTLSGALCPTVVTLEGPHTDAWLERGCWGWLGHLLPGEPVGPTHRVLQLPCIQAWTQKKPAWATHPQFCTRNPRKGRGPTPPTEMAEPAPEMTTKPAPVVGPLTSFVGWGGRRRVSSTAEATRDQVGRG